MQLENKGWFCFGNLELLGGAQRPLFTQYWLHTPLSCVQCLQKMTIFSQLFKRYLYFIRVCLYILRRGQLAFLSAC